jgi:hypothetical protein
VSDSQFSRGKVGGPTMTAVGMALLMGLVMGLCGAGVFTSKAGAPQLAERGQAKVVVPGEGPSTKPSERAGPTSGPALVKGPKALQTGPEGAKKVPAPTDPDVVPTKDPEPLHRDPDVPGMDPEPIKKD